MSRITLRAALENETAPVTTDQKTVVMSGPLAEIYRKALDIAYAKPDPLTGEVTLESMAQDAQLMHELASRTQAPANATPDVSPEMTVFGVAPTDLEDEAVVVDLTKRLMAPNSGDHLILVIDGTDNPSGNNVPQERVHLMSEAMESMATAHSVRVFHSLSEVAAGIHQPKQ